MDDLISRQAVLENAFAIYTHECGLVEVVGVATIKDLPSVKPQETCDVPDTNDGKMSENPTGSKDVIWYSKRNYSEIVVEPQERSE